MAIADLFYLNASGLSVPDYPTVLEEMKSAYRGIYGADVYLEADSQDGQWIAIMSLAIFDTMQVAAQVYNSFSPATAQSDALSRNVKINGIARRVATFSTVDLRIIGQSGTTIINGIAEDSLGQKWAIPGTVVIPSTGDLTVTATSTVIGAINAAANTITKIATPTLGWQTVNNPSAAAPGIPVETDAELRRRQTQSVAIPAQSVLDGIIGAVASLDGVGRYRGYENDGDVTDANGIPAHSISLVVEGGTAQSIAETIATKKTPGTGTYGTTAVTTADKFGMENVINFFRPTNATISVEVTVDALTGYISSYADLIKAAVVASLTNLDIGDDVLITKLYVPANLPGTDAGATFDLTQIRIKKNSGSWVTTNIALAFNEIAICSTANVTVIAT
jgi:uncharacterized phage protein gp47/JayE